MTHRAGREKSGACADFIDREVREIGMEKFDLRIALAALEACDSIAITDASGEYVYVNQNWSENVGYTFEQLRGKRPWDIVPDSKAQEAITTRLPVLAHQHIHSTGRNIVTYYYPLMDGDSFLGILIRGQFVTKEYALHFSRMIDDLSKELATAKETLRMMSSPNYNMANIIGESEAIVKLRQDIFDAARTASTVLIEGETGVGKELVAHAIHNCSVRSAQRFVRVNCSAIPAELAEAEFFGYESGAFTGARKGGMRGKFEVANHGSLFLDEVNQLSPTLQPKFLRVLQEREVERVGGSTVVPIDTRIIAATNVPLRQLVDEGSFRRDLYYRLNVVRLVVPPLRERREDIPILAQNFLLKLNHQLGMDISSIEGRAYELMSEHSWPGNIRELQNAMERAMIRCKGDTLKASHFEMDKANIPSRPRAQEFSPYQGSSLSTLKADMEYDAIRKALVQAWGNKTKAAELLGISRNAFYKKLRKYGDKLDAQ